MSIETPTERGREMTHYKVYNPISGMDMGGFEGETEDDAVLACWHDAGYTGTLDECLSQMGVDENDLVATEIDDQQEG
jgi:hypothetical protein